MQRLHQMAPNAGCGCPLGIGGKTGVHDDVEMGELWILPEPRDELPAVHLGHGEVGEDGTRAEAGLELRERRGPTCGGMRLDVDGLEILDDRVPVILGVVDDEHRVAMRWHCAAPQRAFRLARLAELGAELEEAFAARLCRSSSSVVFIETPWSV